MSNVGLTVEIENEPNWSTKPLGNLCRLISRGTAPVYVEHSEVLAIGQRCVASTGFTPDFARPHSHRAMSNVLKPESGDVLLNSTGTGTIGRSVVFNSPGTFIVDGHVTVMRPQAELADSRWLNSMLRTPALQRHLERFCFSGSTNQLELSCTPLAISQIPTPNIFEQQKIAQVLDTIDTAISETEAIIAKINSVKQGLLHDLLTRGIGVNSELRPTQAEAPHLYKDSPLGWIPQEWSCDRLEDLIDVKLGFAFSSHDYVDDGVLSFRVTNIGQPSNDLGGVVKLPKDFLEKFPKQRLDGGEIMIVMVGATTGKMGRVPRAVCPALQNQNMWNLVPKANLDTDFAWMALPSLVERHLKQAQGSARDFLTQSAFLVEYLAVPPPSEQTVLVNVFSVIDSRLENENSFAEKLRAQKKGLMDDLLTGRVRATQLMTPTQHYQGDD
jgi:type I restriction enzyme S subunit